MDPTVRALEDNPRPAEAEDVVDGVREGVRVLRVGVDGREEGRMVGEFMVPGVWGRELGVDGLVFWEGLVVLSLEVVVEDGRVLEGVEPRDGVVRVDGVEGLAVVEERLVGVEGLMYEETEAELVFRMLVFLFE